MTLEARPELAARIRDRFGRAALLRVQQAAREDNEALVKLATVQYAGSEAAAEARSRRPCSPSGCRGRRVSIVRFVG